MQEEDLSAERQVNSEFSFANICRILMVFQQQFSQTNMITVWYNPLPASHCSSCDTAQQPQPGGLHRHTGRWWTACSNSLGFALHSRAPSASRQGPQTHHRDVSRAQRCLECKRKQVGVRTGSALGYSAVLPLAWAELGKHWATLLRYQSPGLSWVSYVIICKFRLSSLSSDDCESALRKMQGESLVFGFLTVRFY